MAYPASVRRLDQALERTDSVALSLSNEVSQIRALAVVEPVERVVFLALIRALSGAVDTWDETAALPGIVAFARDQKGDQVLDVAAEFSAMRAAAVDMKDWLVAAFPEDPGTGAWLVNDYDADGKAVPLFFTVAQLSGFVTRADALTATIG